MSKSYWARVSLNFLSVLIIGFISYPSAYAAPSEETIKENMLTRAEKAKKRMAEGLKYVQEQIHDDVVSLQSKGSVFMQYITEGIVILQVMNSKPEVRTNFVKDLYNNGIGSAISGFKSREDGRQRIGELLTDAPNIFENTIIVRLKGKIDADTVRITALKKSISDDTWKLKYQGSTIPDSKSFYQVHVMTKDDYRERIERNKSEIEQIAKARDENKLLILIALKEAGVTLKSPKQYDALMNSINGADDIRIFSAAQTIKTYMQMKAEILAANPSDMAIAQDYYAERTLLIKVLIYMHERYLERVTKEYKPKLTKLIEDSQTRIEELNDKMVSQNGNLTDAEQLVSKRSISLLEKQVPVARSYLEFLDKNADRVQQSLDKLKDRYTVSESAYFAIYQANKIQEEIQAADFLGEQIINFEMPDIAVADFGNLETDLQNLNNEIQAR